MPGTGLSVGFRAAIVLATVVGGYLLFEFGRLQAEYNIVEAVSERRAHEAEVQGLEEQIAALKQEVALQETHREIDREAYQVVEARFSELESKIQEQSDAIAFYRGIVSPKDGSRGLRIQDLKLSRGSEERHYNLHVVLVQVMQHDRTVKGVVEFIVEGAQDGVPASYELSQLLPEGGNSNWPFAFRYFQDFDRELILPDGFTPEKISIEVISTTKSISNVKQSFDWQVGQG
jgi:hypothetical protein